MYFSDFEENSKSGNGSSKGVVVHCDRLLHQSACAGAQVHARMLRDLFTYCPTDKSRDCTFHNWRKYTISRIRGESVWFHDLLLAHFIHPNRNESLTAKQMPMLEVHRGAHMPKTAFGNCTTIDAEKMKRRQTNKNTNCASDKCGTLCQIKNQPLSSCKTTWFNQPQECLPVGAIFFFVLFFCSSFFFLVFFSICSFFAVGGHF
jgi:hypothetical protein